MTVGNEKRLCQDILMAQQNGRIATQVVTYFSHTYPSLSYSTPINSTDAVQQKMQHFYHLLWFNKVSIFKWLGRHWSRQGTEIKLSCSNVNYYCVLADKLCPLFQHACVDMILKIWCEWLKHVRGVRGNVFFPSPDIWMTQKELCC